MPTVEQCLNELLAQQEHPLLTNNTHNFSFSRNSIDGGNYSCIRKNSGFGATGSYRLGNQGEDVWIALNDTGETVIDGNTTLHNLLIVHTKNTDPTTNAIGYGNGSMYMNFQYFIYLLRADRFSIVAS